MIQKQSTTPNNTCSKRTNRAGRAVAALIALAAIAAGCSDTFKQFRERAQPGIQDGVTSLVNGILDGMFAVGDTDGPSNTNTNGG